MARKALLPFPFERFPPFGSSMSFCCVKNHTFLKNLASGRLRIPRTLNYTGCRALLSAAYQCNDAWNQRLKGSHFRGINLDDFFNEMDKKFKSKRRVTALDIDLFTNSIDSHDRFEELEHILYQFRRTRSTVRTLDSTHHAVVRLMLKYGHEELLLRILSNRIKYGIFPDVYAMNLAMDYFIEKKNYRDASRIASLLMLQEDLSHPVSCILALYACHMHLKEADAEPWHDSAPLLQDEDEEEELVRIPFLRNPCFDDHFDLTLREHLLGKTLYHVGKEMKDDVGRSYAAVGLALYQKWSLLQEILKDFENNKEPILKESADYIKSLVESAESTKPASEAQEMESKSLEAGSDQETESAIDSTSPSHEESNNVVGPKQIIDRLSVLQAKALIVDGNLQEMVNAKLKNLTKLEDTDISAIRKQFQEWEETRDSELKREFTLVALREAQAAVDAKKKELKEKEQLLFFFENEEKHLMEVAKIDKEDAKKTLDTVHQEDYVVPEMPRKMQYAPVSKTRR